MRAHAIKAVRGIRWYLKQVSGEAKWDEYLERARSEDMEPMSRRDFERHRSEHERR
jgi:Selenoprotein, putative